LGWGCKKSTDSKNDTVTIAYVTNGVDPFWDLCAAGVRIAEKEFNIKCEVHMPTKGVVDQKRIMESLLAKGVDGIAISPIDAANQTKFLNEIAQNTKLITQDADAPDSDRLAYIGTNNYLAGRALGKLVKAAIPEGGEVFILVGRLEQLNARQRRQGVIDELLGKPEQKLGSVKFDAEDAKNLTAEGSKYIILETRTDNFDKAKAKSNAESGIAKYKNLKCMVGLFAYNPPACLDAIKEAGLTGKIKVCGFDEPDAMLQAIKDGTAYGTISQQPWKYGYESVKMLKNILDGQAPASTFLEVPFLVVTKENVDEFWKTKREMAELGKQ
jgi:ribose transport system substrate-binding protein